MKTKQTTYLMCFGLLALSMVMVSAAPATFKKEPLSHMQKHKAPVKKRYIKVALLLDTSNSMDGLINQAKAQLWDIVNELSYARCENEAPNLQIALYEYGNDRLPSREGYIRQILGFSSDLDEISEKLFSLTTNGGSEFCGQVIQTSLKQLDWGKNPDDLKLIFIAGNEPFTQGRVFYKDAIADAMEGDIIVNTIFCGDYYQGIQSKWKDGAVMSGGDYMSIDHNREIVQIITPYDDVIIELNHRLNGTYIPYGAHGYHKMQNQAEQDANAESLNEEVVVKRAVSKSSGMYNNASWDLVDAAKEKSFDYEALKKEQLPKDLRSKSASQLKAYVSEKSRERNEIQKKIQALNKKRASFIAKAQKDQTDSGSMLETAMIKAIRKQAEKKNYVWK